MPRGGRERIKDVVFKLDVVFYQRVEARKPETLVGLDPNGS